MSTKVKGEAIKEGSIPLSALHKDFSKNLKIDWKNITNSPFGESAGATGEVKCNYVEYKDGYYYFKVSYVDPYLIQTVVGNGFTKYNDVLKSKYIILQISDENTPEYKADIVNIDYDSTDHIIIVRTRNYGDYFNSPEEAAEFITNTTSDMGKSYIAKLPSIFVEQELSDWNAQEGEAGYIENKPFRIIKSKNGLITNINSYFIITESEYTPTNNLYIKYNNEIALLAKEKQELYYGDGAVVDIDNFSVYLGDGDNSNIMVINYENIDFELLIALSSEFIPDTVLKTTPQTLSDSDKNQALANLGIDPVVWKYMCKPYVIQSGDPSGTIPKELVQIIFSYEQLQPIVQNVITFITGPIKSIFYSQNVITDANDMLIEILTDGTWNAK